MTDDHSHHLDLPAPAGDPRLLNRRAVVAGAGAATLGAGLLAAGCASTAASAPTAAAPTATGPAGGGQPARTTLGATADVPVGGGKVFADQKIVVTQPTAGTFVGLSAVCTHQGCVVNKVAAGTIDCPCHGSKYHLDGTVAAGPAPKALAPVRVTVSGSDITLA